MDGMKKSELGDDEPDGMILSKVTFDCCGYKTGMSEAAIVG